MSVLASAIISEASTSFLHDEDNDRWTQDEQLQNINDGQRMIVFLKPDANVFNTGIPLKSGTKQSIPDGSAEFKNDAGETLAAGMSLLDVVRNMGSDGLTPGDAISIVDRHLLDTGNPSWHSDTGANAVSNYVFSEQDPKTFYCTPPQPSTDLITNGVFSSDSDWQKGTGVSIGSGVASVDGSQIAETTIYQASVLDTTAREWYEIIIDVTVTAGNWRVKMGVSATADDDCYTAWQADGGTKLRFVLKSWTDSIGRFVLSGDSDFIGTFDNVSVRKVNFIEIVYSAIVADLTATTDAINLGDEYREALLFFNLFKCYLKDAGDSAYAMERATYFWGLFATLLGRRDMVEESVDPNKHSPKPSPSIVTTQEGAPWQI